MTPSNFDFVNIVVADLDLVVTTSHRHACRLEPRESIPGWYCDLDDGTPTGESDPATFVRWVCPALRTAGPATGAAYPVVDVHRSGPQSDLGKLVQKFRLLTGRPPESVDERFVYTDPAGVLDADLRRRIENWPPALHGDGVVRPAELSSIRRNSEGLIVESVSWWGSAAALDHQLRLAVDISQRLTALR